MKVEEYGLVDKIRAVKEIDDESIEKIEEIIESLDYAMGSIKIPSLEIESYSGQLVPQQLVIIKYKELDEVYQNVRNGYIVSYYNKLDSKLLKETVFTSDKINLLKESILFDIYLRSSIHRFNKRLVEAYMEYNSMLLESLIYMDRKPTSLKEYVSDTIYSNFSKFINKNKITKR